MTVALGIRFPLGRYHATPWDRSVNEGAVEWPPSPWRLLRTLVATRHNRWPDLPEFVLDELLDRLGEPPSYWTPSTEAGHSRHYMPGSDHKKGETGGTGLTLDPFLYVDRDAELVVRWDTDLTSEQREILTKLVELMPYLGRAESVCEARVLSDVPTPDDTWWRPFSTGAETTRLLAARRPIRRSILELTTVEIRKKRRTMPPETMWVTYARNAEQPRSTRSQRAPVRPVEAVRFSLIPRAPFKLTHGVLLADEVHRLVTRELDGGRTAVLGHGGAETNHNHAHWIPIPGEGEHSWQIQAFVVRVPAGLTAEEVAKIIHVRKVSGRRGGNEGYEVKGFPDSELLLQSVGSIEQVAPELTGRARSWRSLTPYLPVRHRRRESLDTYVTNDVRTELGYRELTRDVTVSRVSPDEGLSDRWALGFRRYRLNEHLGQARRGLGLRLRFADEVAGPLLLGQLSHFGYGIFVPDEG